MSRLYFILALPSQGKDKPPIMFMFIISSSPSSAKILASWSSEEEDLLNIVDGRVCQ